MTLQDIKCTGAIRHRRFDPDAGFAANLVELMPLLRMRAVVLTGKRELAEDLAQEALAKAWGARKSFKANTNLKAWLFTILRNEYFSRQRLAWRQVPCSAEFAESVPAASDGQYGARRLRSQRREPFEDAGLSI